MNSLVKLSEDLQETQQVKLNTINSVPANVKRRKNKHLKIEISSLHVLKQF